MITLVSKPDVKSLFEEGLKGLRDNWYKRRKEAVLQRVSAFEILRRNGVSVKQVSDSRAEQIKCPFHGQDNKPSARIYPDTTERPSHVWCYVCQKSWDAIGLQMEFSGSKFAQALSDLERTYGLEVPEAPKDLSEVKKGPAPDKHLLEFQRMGEVCENRLVVAKPLYQALGDFQGYAQASSILDKLSFRVEHKKLSVEKGLEILQQLLVKINQKIQAGYDYLEQGP